MGIIIDHNARKNAIIQKSIQLFAEQGYNGVTFQKIADSCGIARTTLYKYFKNKREIFNYAIWDVSNILIEKYDSILQQDLPAATKLTTIMDAVLELLFKQRMILTVILDYILAAQRAGHSLEKNITSHTIALRRIVQRLIVGGMRTGELRKINAALATDLVYAQMETAILRLTISRNADLKQLTLMMHETIENLKNTVTVHSGAPQRACPVGRKDVGNGCQNILSPILFTTETSPVGSNTRERLQNTEEQ